MAISLSNNKGTADKTAARLRRQARGRKKIHGSPERPRLVVTRSSRHLFVQVIDDTEGRTLASASTLEADVRKATGDKTEVAKKVGTLIADRAKAAGVEILGDEGGDRVHGRLIGGLDGDLHALLGAEGCKTNGFDNFDKIAFWKTPQAEGGKYVPYSRWTQDYIAIMGGR